LSIADRATTVCAVGHTGLAAQSRTEDEKTGDDTKHAVGDETKEIAVKTADTSSISSS
jgi:hypothetical protein